MSSNCNLVLHAETIKDNIPNSWLLNGGRKRKRKPKRLFWKFFLTFVSRSNNDHWKIIEILYYHYKRHVSASSVFETLATN